MPETYEGDNMRKGMQLFSAARAICVGALFVAVWPSLGVAQTTSPEDEYKKLIRIDQEVHPLGETPFGESLSLYDGSFSFQVTDITVPGTGPLITIGRSFKADGDSALRQGNAAFGDWDIDVPKLTTIASDADTIIAGPVQKGWLVDSVTRTDRCTHFGAPPALRHGSPGSEDIPPEKWWNEDYQLRMPGEESRTVLVRSPESPAAPTISGINFVAVTKDNWAVGCLAATTSGEPGEGFLAVGPDGTKYWLTYLVYRAARPFVVNRKMGYMLATRIEDRFGNWVTYTYSAGKLTSIDASDGRRVTLDYIADGTQIWHVIVATADGSQTWTYGYATTSTGYTLTNVTLPDGSAWTYQFSQLGYQVKSTAPNGHCLDPNLPDTSVLVVGSATSPSGLSVALEAHPARHGRSGVTEMCDVPGGGSATIAAYELTPRYYNNLALTKKTFSGAGIDSQSWTYSYPTAKATWKSACSGAACNYTSLTEVVDPSSNMTRYTFSNRFDVTEGLLLQTDNFNGSGGSPLRTVSNAYALPTDGAWPWPTRYGYNLASNLNTDKVVEVAPLKQSSVTEEGDSYTWQAVHFDARARPYYTKRFSSVAGQLAMEEQITYLDDLSKWVIGLTTQLQNMTTGKVVTQTDYDASTLHPTARRSFGRTVMTYGFNTQGLLASFTDARQHTTTLGNYKRGIPQSVGFPDGTSESLSVNDLGQIRSSADQAGRVTTYDYDALGRVSKVTYPAGDIVNWAPAIITFSKVATAERGISGAHWRRVLSQGTRSSTTYFDAMLRPLLASSYRTSDNGLAVTTARSYNWRGNTTFASWPVSGLPDISAISDGVTNTYDALGRSISSSQPSEVGSLTNTTSYISGARKQVIDGRGASTVTTYQVFDAPSYEAVVKVEAPEGVLQTIARDVFGNPISIAQSGVGVSGTKTLVYDAYNRPCRVTESESGSSVIAYDPASNIAWQSGGLAITGDGCGQDQVADAAKTTFTYDAMNRLTNTTYPAGTAADSYNYTATGKLLSETAGGVTWTYGYNKLDLMSDQTLSVDGYAWLFVYGYDQNGALSSLTYPDNKVVAFSPDSLGRPTTAGSYASSATYHPDGELEHFTLANGADYSSTKNSRRLLDAFVFSKAGVVNVGEAFQYDRNANETVITDLAANSRTRTFSYDNLNRISSATALGLWGTESYTYDALNNIRSLTSSGQTSTYNYDASNRLATVTASGTTPSSYSYDARGNVSSRNGVALTFDTANRITQIAGTGSNLYDSEGRRVKKTPVSGSPTYFAYGNTGQLLWQYEPGTSKATDYIYLGKKLVASTSATWLPPPSRPTVLNVGLPNDQSYIATAWAAASGATSYQLQQMFNNGTWTSIYNGTATSFWAQNPSDGVYYFRVQACTVGGCSAWTNSTAVGVDHMPASPAVLNVALASDFSGILTAWSPSTKATGYTLEQSLNGGAWSTAYTGPATTFTVNLPPDGTYNFRVKACNSGMCSPTVASSAVGVYHPIAAIAAISVPGTSNGPIAIGWATTAYATTYALEQNWGGGWSEIYRGAANSYSYVATVTGGYSYRARGCNAALCGAYSPVASSAITIPPTGIAAISTPGSNHNGSYSISWGGIAGASTYHLVEQVNGGGWTEIKNDASTSWSTAGRGNATYGYMVQGCNAGGCAPWSAVATVAVSLIPNPPSNFGVTDTVVNTKNETRVAAWNASALATSYQLKDFNTGQIVYNSTALSFTVERGVPGNLPLHDYQIAACNSVGCSAWKNPDYSN